MRFNLAGYFCLIMAFESIGLAIDSILDYIYRAHLYLKLSRAKSANYESILFTVDIFIEVFSKVFALVRGTLSVVLLGLKQIF